MKAYVITTAVAFTLLTLAHVWRTAMEGWVVMKDPWFGLSTLIATGLAIWAWRIAATLRRSWSALPGGDDTPESRHL